MLQQELKNKELNNSSLEKANKHYITPTVNIYESAEDTRIILDMPGVDENSVDISFEKGVLTIEGRNSYATPEGYEVTYQEFRVGDYFRKFNINKPIDLEKTRAVIKNGKLTLYLTKVKPNTKKIEVKIE